MLRAFNKYIGLPYVKKGRTLEGFDCYGLVYLAYKMDLAIELPSYGEISADDLLATSRNLEEGAKLDIWSDVAHKDIQPYDVVAMRKVGGKVLSHCGLVVSKTHLIHSLKTTDCAIVALDDFTIRERIACFRRHKKLATAKF